MAGEIAAIIQQVKALRFRVTMLHLIETVLNVKVIHLLAGLGRW